MVEPHTHFPQFAIIDMFRRHNRRVSQNRHVFGSRSRKRRVI